MAVLHECSLKKHCASWFKSSVCVILTRPVKILQSFENINAGIWKLFIVLSDIRVSTVT